jgi:RNA polymerase sigma-70 factor, ECF subfamily
MPPRDDRILEFSNLLHQSRGPVFALIYAIVLNMADTEDVFQQTASLLWEKFDEYQPGTNFTGWALSVARFKAANFVRGRYRERQRFSSNVIEQLYQASVSSPDSGHEDRLDALRACLSKLSEKDRQLVYRCYGADLQIKEVARQEGRNANALYATLHRIRRVLLLCVKRIQGAGDSVNLNEN